MDGFEANVAAVLKWPDEIKAIVAVVGKDRMKTDVFLLKPGDIHSSY